MSWFSKLISFKELRHKVKIRTYLVQLSYDTTQPNKFECWVECSANFVFSDTSNPANVRNRHYRVLQRFINTKSWIPWMSMFLLSMKFLIASGVITITRGSTITVDLATLWTISSCNYIQIPFSEAGSILQSITFSGVSQSKLCICIIIDYYWNVFWLFNKLLNSFSLQQW